MNIHKVIKLLIASWRILLLVATVAIVIEVCRPKVFVDFLKVIDFGFDTVSARCAMVLRR